MRWLWTLALALLAPVVGSGVAQAYTANKVWFEFRTDGRYRVYVNYTIPELKEYREAWVDFAAKREAERFYFDLVRGADFYPPDPKARRFVNPELKPDPW